MSLRSPSGRCRVRETPIGDIKSHPSFSYQPYPLKLKLSPHIRDVNNSRKKQLKSPICQNKSLTANHGPIIVNLQPDVSKGDILQVHTNHGREKPLPRGPLIPSSPWVSCVSRSFYKIPFSNWRKAKNLFSYLANFPTENPT